MTGRSENAASRPPDGRTPEGTPRWVWAGAVVVLLILLGVVLLHVMDGGMGMHG